MATISGSSILHRLVVACGVASLLAFPAIVFAQPQSRTTRTVVDSPAPLVRLSKGQVCDVYPGGPFRNNANGTATFGYMVEADGTVSKVGMIASSGNPQLDGHAGECIRSWKFQPLALTGAPAPYVARAMVSVSFANGGGKRAATTQWLTPGAKDASDIAINALAELAYQCLHGNPAVAPLAHEAASATALKLRLRHGEVESVSVAVSSGDGTLDKAAVACYQGVAHDDHRAQMMDKLTDADISLNWRTLFPG